MSYANDHGRDILENKNLHYFSINDFNELFSSSLDTPLNELIDSSTILGSTDADTSPYADISNSSSFTSQSQSTSNIDSMIIDDHGNTFDESSLEWFLSIASPIPDTLHRSIIEDLLHEYQYEKISIIAEPQNSYRGRYGSEINDQASRFIQAEKKTNRHKYPTIKILKQWHRPNQLLYVRVTLISAISENAPVPCLHPYKIDTKEGDVIRDLANNSLFFLITDKDFETGEKCFRIVLKKLKQDLLNPHGLMRLLDSDQNVDRGFENPQNAKQFIEIYQLQKSRFHFTLAEPVNGKLTFTAMLHTSAISETMIDTNHDSTETSIDDQTDTTFTTGTIKCIPQKGDWIGNEEVVLIMADSTKGKGITISFDFGQYGKKPVDQVSYIDKKIILFRTPPCPKLLSNDSFRASIIVKRKRSSFPAIDFDYLTPIKTNTMCSECARIIENDRTTNKRINILVDDFRTDGNEILTSEMNQLSIEQKPVESRHSISSTSSLDDETKFDIYLNKLKVSLADYVRTNNPSRLFRRTRLLLVKCEESPPPLNDAIQRGHIDLALSLIEQVIEMHVPNGLLEKENENGQTPLLIAAKINQWKLIEIILNKRSDLAQQKDKNGNNLFHLLANLSEDDKAAQTMKNIMEILPNDVKVNLLKEKNENNQTAMEIAQANGNSQCMDLLKCSVDVGENNA